ncbi:MAG: endonuclease V, partial [Gaiellaceae bacterium]
MEWPQTEEELVATQQQLARAAPGMWQPPPERWALGGCFVCSQRGKRGAGARGDRAWAAAALLEPGAPPATGVIEGETGAPYAAGLLA